MMENQLMEDSEVKHVDENYSTALEARSYEEKFNGEFANKVELAENVFIFSYSKSSSVPAK